MSRLVQGLCAALLLLAATSAQAATVNLGGIVWENDLGTAYRSSLQEGKPMCVLFVREGEYYSDQMKTLLEDERLLAPYRDHAIFVLVDVDHDDSVGNVKQMMTSLGIEVLPSLVLMRTSATSIDEIDRVRGHFPADKLAVLLGNLFESIVFPPAAATTPAADQTVPATQPSTTEAAPDAPA